MAEAEPGSLLALRYMVDFRCIGGDCEDSCCHSGWAIYVDQEHLIQLRRLLPRTSPPPNESRPASEDSLPAVDEVLTLLPKKERSERAYAQLRLSPDGSCRLLGAGGLCRLHARFGEDVLPDTCATYPRQLSRVGHRLELAGALSCPEVARRALLPADGTDLVPASAALAGRGQLQHIAPAESELKGDAAYRHLDVVRGAMVRLLTLSTYPLRSRLFFAAFLAHKCAGLPRDKSGVVPAEAFRQQAAMLEHPEVLAELDRRFQDSLTSAPLPLPLLLELLRTQRRVPGGHAFTQLVVELAQSYGQAGAEGGPRADGRPDTTTDKANDKATDKANADSPDEPAIGGGSERVDVAYRARREAIEAVFSEALERYFCNYARHFWMKEWYTDSPSLFLHMQGFLARLALLRFTLLSHPQALAATQAESPAAGQALLDQLAVRVFYSLSRTLEHSGGYRAILATEVKTKAAGLADSISLLTV